jgi:pentafunctional AROM polypeptide
MLLAGCNRDCGVLALGGGVVGDLAGYVAATYMRGVPVVQIPTTMLAMVDSSVGGKTGINTQFGKNLIGAFHQPLRVIIDVAFLDSLPGRQLVNGLAECLKTFAIRNARMFAALEHGLPDADDGHAGNGEVKGEVKGAGESGGSARRRELLLECVIESVRIKADIVTQDEKESGVRELLNFGHTIGHAVEALCMDFLLHGECVAIGMIRETEAARALSVLSSADAARLHRAIKTLGLPTELPPDLLVDDLMAKMAIDKKTRGATKSCVLLSAIGSTSANSAVPVPDELLRLVLARSLAVVPPALPPTGRVRVPGSKSISNRVLLMTALGQGTCRIRGLLHSEDTQVMMAALSALGAARFENLTVTNPDHSTEQVLLVHGSAAQNLHAPADLPELYLANAGTASRFLTSMCTLLPPSQHVVLTGNARHQERPMADLIAALSSFQDCRIEPLKLPGCLPVRIHGSGLLKGGVIELSAKISSQYVSSVLMAAPYARSPVELRIADGIVVSQPYIDMTIQLMAQFGVHVQRRQSSGALSYLIPNSPYQNPPEFIVEADASSATYPLAIAAITGGQITVDFVGSGSCQGDAQFVHLLHQMGCAVSQDPVSTSVLGRLPSTCTRDHRGKCRERRSRGRRSSWRCDGRYGSR